MISGETSREAVGRELYEELGIKIPFENYAPALTINSGTYFDDIYTAEADLDLSELKLQYEEVQNVKWASCEEIIKMIDDGIFIPYHKSFAKLLFWLRNNRTVRTHEDFTGKF